MCILYGGTTRGGHIKTWKEYRDGILFVTSNTCDNCKPVLPARDVAIFNDALKEIRNNRTIVEGLSLERLVGPDGLMVLLSLLAAGDLPKAQIIELTKRLHIPGYELSRNLSGATAKIALTAYLGEGFYLQSELEALIARAIEEYAEPSSDFRSL
jgi:hypothetical protein